MYSIAFAGYATADIIENEMYLGGAAGMMSINAPYLGVYSSLLAPLGKDTYGKLYQKHLHKNKVNTSLCFLVPHLPICVIENVFGAGSNRQWNDNGANKYISKIKLDQKTIQSFDGVFLANSHPLLAEKVAEYSPDNLFYIPGPQVVKQKDYVRISILKKTRVVFGNEEEAPFIFDKKPFLLGVEIVVITYGKKGGEIFLHNGRTIKFDAPKVKKVTDTTGAGDAFALGFGFGILDRKTVADAIAGGKKLVKKTLTQEGGLIFTHL